MEIIKTQTSKYFKAYKKKKNISLIPFVRSVISLGNTPLNSTSPNMKRNSYLERKDALSTPLACFALLHKFSALLTILADLNFKDIFFASSHHIKLKFNLSDFYMLTISNISTATLDRRLKALTSN